jgi:uncharacterized lipoprotein
MPQKLAFGSGANTLLGNVKRCGLGVLLAIFVLNLTACGNSKKVVTKDNSADYRAAVSLPPLKKPSKGTQSPPLVENRSPVEQVTEPSEPAPLTENTAAAKTFIEPDESETNATLDSDLPPVPNPVIQARVINPNEQAARLQIDSEFSGAWTYLQNNLKKSDITVYSRNESAGRISIGCADVEDAPVIVKRGGWSFLSKKKNEKLEYCALQAISTKGSTLVTVLNRAGQEVDKDYAVQIFQRVLNN